MVRLRKHEKVLIGVVVTIIGIVLIGVVLLTQTDWGRRHVLSFGLNQLASRVHGKVTVGNIHGNLLAGARLEPITITDTAGRPFLHADTLALRYSLRSLLRRHLVLSDVRLVNATVILDQPPGEEWNFARIFPTTPDQPNRGPGFGSWIVIENTTVRNSNFVVRSTWSPPDTLRGAARQRAIANALAPTNRMLIVPAGKGYQTVSQFSRVNGEFPFMRLADPDSATRFIQIRKLSMTAQPFRPPAADVRDMAARVLITKDSILFDSLRIVLPNTRGNGLGGYALNGSGARVQLALRPVDFKDIRLLKPDLPAGGGQLDLAFASHNHINHIVASKMDVRAEGAHIRGLADLTAGRGEYQFGPSNVTFDGVQTSLIKRYAPNVPLNAPGMLAGQIRLAGTTAAMRVDGWTNFTQTGGPTSRIVMDGGVGNSGGAFTATGLRLRFEPLYLSLVKSYAPNIPYRGAVTGTATLTGSSNSGFSVVADLVDNDPSAGRSRILANGRIDSRNGFTARGLRLRLAPLQVAMIKPFAPRIPYGGTLSGTTTLTGSPSTGFSIVADVTHVDSKYGRSRVGANGRVAFTNGFTADNLKLRFDPLQVALAEPFVKDLPYGGTITGTTTLNGSERRGFNIVADVSHNSARTGRSHVTANGWVNFVDGITTRALRLGFEPLQVAVLRPFVTNLPIDGTLKGRATVTSSTAARDFAAVLDIEHTGSTGNSHVIGRTGANWAGRGAFDVDVRAPVLSLATVGAFAPAAGLHGAASGTIIARGTLANLGADLNLAFANGGGAMHTRGTFDLTGAVKRYDLTSTVTAFNGAAVTSHMPQTLLNGTVVAIGAGTDPATATASLTANLTGSRAANSPVIDTALVQARLANGLATFDRGHVRLGSAKADISGSFGLIAAQSGTLRYSLTVDTLSQFFAHIPVDTGTIYPRPLLTQRRLAQARVDSVRIARITEVQRAAVGYPPPPALKPDTTRFRRDTLAGSLRADGTLTGNIKTFDARGTAVAKHFSAGASHIGAGNATYAITGFGTPNMSADVEAFGDTVHLDGFAFDSARAKIKYTGVRNQGSGTADIAMYQDPDRDYRAVSDFALALDRKQLALRNLTLRFDTTRWTAVHPTQIGWGKPGVTIANLEMRSNTGGYLRADGRLPTNGPADLKLDIDRLQVGDISTLLQDTGSVKGLLGLHARVQGTGASPVIEGNATLVEGNWGGQVLPDIRTTLNYANKDLKTHTELYRANTQLAVADAHLPINLAISGVTGPRILRSVPLQIDVRADSLPLDAVPKFTTAVSDVKGRLRGNATVRGTFDHPDLNGLAQLDLGSMRVTSTNVLYENINGSVRLHGDTAFVDSVVAHAGGEIRATGTLDFETLTRPSFNLMITGHEAMIIDDKRGRIFADGNVTAKGPYTGLVVEGEAQVLNGTIYAPESQNTRATNLQDPTLIRMVDTAAIGLEVLPPPNPLMQNLRVDIALRIAPNTWVRNTQMNVEIYTPDDEDPLRVHMDNAHQVLTITGVINTDRGEYSVAGRSFQLTTGSVTFLGEPTINPLLQLTANYQVQRRGIEALIIQIHVNGTLREPRVTLQSNSQPPLAQSDLLSYLAFGQSTTSLLTLGSSSGLAVGSGGATGVPLLAGQQLAGLALGAMVDQAVNQIEQEGSRSGLDVFRVHAGELPPEATFSNYFSNFFRGTEIEAGKYLSRRLFFSARGRMSTYPGLSLQYRGPLGFTWTGAWEPRYIPIEPTLSSTLTAERVRALGLLMLWNRRF